MENQPRIALASTSPFRKKSLERLGLVFETVDPEVDETPVPGESASQMAVRLAEEKAAAGALLLPDRIVVAGDQVLEANGRCYGKPGDEANSIRQLQELSGATGVFHSGMCVRRDDEMRTVNVTTETTWRELTDREIRAYVEREPSFGSAGAAQLEGLGVSLVARMASEDPTAILGLPMISLCAILNEMGVRLPG